MANSPDIEILYFLMAGTLGMFILSTGIVGFVILYHIKLQKHRLRVQELETGYHKKLVQNNMEEVENERMRISKDLHDEIGSIFSVLGIKLYQLRNATGQPTQETRQLFDESRAVIDSGIQGIRRISHNIIPPALETFGLGAALEDLCRQFGGGPSGLAVEPEIVYPLPEPPGGQSLVIFRIIQELLQNTLRHSGATRVTLRITGEADGLSIRYSDNGKGFVYRRNGTGNGIGMLNLQSRIHQLKADMQLETAPGKGIHVNIHIPNLNTSIKT